MVVVTLFAGKKFASYFLRVESFSCKMDKAISQLHACEIIAFLNVDKKIRALSLSVIAMKLKDKFLIIQDVDLVKSASGILHVGIKVMAPKFVINRGHVLSTDGVLFDKSLFSISAVAGCPAIGLKGLDFVATGSKVADQFPKSCNAMLHRLPAGCFDIYDIVWERETKSWLFEKDNKKFAILFNDFRVPDKKLLAACAKLKNDLESKGCFSCKCIGRWIADVRFKDQIVVSKDIGGGDG